MQLGKVPVSWDDLETAMSTGSAEWLSGPTRSRRAGLSWPTSPGRSGSPTSGRLPRRVAMSETAFLVPSSTGTHGDVLVAGGLADLLGSILDAGVVRIREDEIGFVVSVPGGVNLERLPQHPGYPFLKVKPAVAVPRGAVDVVDYQNEKAKADRRKLARSAAGKRRRGRVEPEIDQAIQEDAPREDWPLLQVFNSLQGDETSNRIHAAIVGRTPNTWHSEMARSLNAFRDGASSGLDWKATTVQLFTPTAAKGYSRLKPDSTDRNDKSKDRWADPLVEWLRYRGYFRVACPFFRGSDVRLLCPVPRDISIRALELLSRELRRGGVPGGPPKLDALAVLRMAELLVRHSEEYHDADTEPWPGLSLAGKTPATRSASPRGHRSSNVTRPARVSRTRCSRRIWVEPSRRKRRPPPRSASSLTASSSAGCFCTSSRITRRGP